MKKWLILTTAFTLSCVGKAMSADLVCGGNTAGLDAVGFKGGTITVDGVFFNNDKSTQSTASSGSGGGGPAGGGAFGLNGATAAINTGNQIITNGLASNTTFQIGGTSITITDQNNNNLLFTTGALSLNGVPFVTATATVKSVAGDSNISVSNNGNGGWTNTLNQVVNIGTLTARSVQIIGPTSQASLVTNSTMAVFYQFQGATTQSTFTQTASSMSFGDSSNNLYQASGGTWTIPTAQIWNAFPGIPMMGPTEGIVASTTPNGNISTMSVVLGDTYYSLTFVVYIASRSANSTLYLNYNDDTGANYSSLFQQNNLTPTLASSISSVPLSGIVASSVPFVMVGRCYANIAAQPKLSLLNETFVRFNPPEVVNTNTSYLSTIGAITKISIRAGGPDGTTINAPSSIEVYARKNQVRL